MVSLQWVRFKAKATVKCWIRNPQFLEGERRELLTFFVAWAFIVRLPRGPAVAETVSIGPVASR